LGEIPGLSQNIEIHIRREQSGDEVKVLVEPKEEMAPTEYDGLRTRAKEELRYRIGVGIDVEPVSPKSLPRYEVKAIYPMRGGM
jgi:phenylacetate-CoA ligase